MIVTIWRFQETNERETAECDSLCYFMNKKRSVAIKKSQRYQEKQKFDRWEKKK